MAAYNEVPLQVVKNLLACENYSRELEKYVIHYFVNSVKGSIPDFLTFMKIVLFLSLILFEALIEVRNWRTETFAFSSWYLHAYIQLKKNIVSEKM